MAEQEFLKQALNSDADDNTPFWPGGKREPARGWVWNFSDDPFGDFTYWAETEPNNDGQCMSLFRNRGNRKWIASDCENEYIGLCETAMVL